MHDPWPAALANHVKVLINPANTALSGPQRAAFPRGGPVPPPPPPEVAKGLRGWDIAGSSMDLLYPAQAVDGLVHLQGGVELRNALMAAPILEERANGEHVRCRVGEAVLTGSGSGANSSISDLPFDAIVHTVPPFWPSHSPNSDWPSDWPGDIKDPASRDAWAAALRRCYTTSFDLALEFARDAVSSGVAAGVAIATPVLGAGARGAPFAPAARVLAEAALERFGSSDDDTYAGRAPTPASLRVLVHPSSLGELAMVQKALAAASDGVDASRFTVSRPVSRSELHRSDKNHARESTCKE